LTEDGQRTERPLKNKAEYQALLKEYFDVTLPEEQA
jgi:hypothetical protein